MLKSLKSNAPLHALLISPSRPMKAELLGFLSQKLVTAKVHEYQSYPTRQNLIEWMSTKPALCFLDMTSDKPRAATLVGELHALDPALIIVGVLANNDSDIVLRCLRQGASEFLVQPISDDQFQHVIDRISKLYAKPSDGHGHGGSGKVYAVMSTKGSGGGSTVAAALAFQFKKNGSKKTLLADLDPLTGILPFILKVNSKYSFLDVISRTNHLDADLWKGIVSNVHGVDLLHSPDNPVDGNADLGDGSSMIVSFSRQLYNTVVLDAHSAFGNWNLDMAKLSDEVLLISTNDLPAVQAAQRVLAYLDHSGVERSRLRLILNRYSEDGLGRNVIETALQMEVFHVLPNDPEAIHKAVVEGKPVGSTTPFGKAIKELTTKLSGEREREIIKKPTALAGFFSMFSRSSS